MNVDSYDELADMLFLPKTGSFCIYSCHDSVITVITIPYLDHNSSISIAIIIISLSFISITLNSHKPLLSHCKDNKTDIMAQCAHTHTHTHTPHTLLLAVCRALELHFLASQVNSQTPRISRFCLLLPPSRFFLGRLVKLR